MSSSVMTVVELHNEAGKIQQIFTSKWISQKDFLISYKTVWLRAIKELGTFLLNELRLEMNEIDNFNNKSCSPNSIFK